MLLLFDVWITLELDKRYYILDKILQFHKRMRRIVITIAMGLEIVIQALHKIYFTNYIFEFIWISSFVLICDLCYILDSVHIHLFRIRWHILFKYYTFSCDAC